MKHHYTPTADPPEVLLAKLNAMNISEVRLMEGALGFIMGGQGTCAVCSICVWRGPVSGLTLCCHQLEMCNFLNDTFEHICICTGPSKLCSWSEKESSSFLSMGLGKLSQYKGHLC